MSRKSGTVYTPKQTVIQEGVVRHFASQAMRGNDVITGPAWLSIHVFKHYPKSWSAKRKRETLFITGTPDADNMFKLVSDSMNGIVWNDDRQVAKIDMERRYIPDTEKERVEVIVYDLNAAPWVKELAA